MIDKTVSTFDEAVADIPHGATILCGGFASPFNMPSYLIAALARQGAGELTVASTSAGTGAENARAIAATLAEIVTWPPDYWDPGLLAELGRIKKLITSCNSSREGEVTRNSSPWICTWTFLKPPSRMSLEIRFAVS